MYIYKCKDTAMKKINIFAAGGEWKIGRKKLFVDLIFKLGKMSRRARAGLHTMLMPMG